MPTHQEIDRRSLAMHCLVAEKVRRDEQLLDKAREILSRWHQTASPRTFGYLDEWQNLLDLGTQACLKIATENSEHASALRQASPLACLLTPKERFDFLKNWKQQHAAH